MPQVASFGSWSSPISAARVAGAAVRLERVQTTESAVWWSESRPDEGGRSQILRRSASGEVAELLPEGFSARSAVHEYGGAGWWLAGETVFFVNATDQRIWRLDPGFPPAPVTPEPVTRRGRRFADGVLTADLRWIICVEEAHPGEASVPAAATEPVNRLVAVPAIGGEPIVLRDQADFVASPRLDARGELLAWIEWSHPDMPWDSTELWVGRWDAAVPRLAGSVRVAGGADESIMQPEWDADHRLWFCSDRSDWSNLYHFPNAGPPSGEPLSVSPANHDIAVPMWQLGVSRYAFLGDDRVVFAASSDGVDHLRVHDPISGRTDHVSVPFTSIGEVRAAASSAVVIASSFTAEPAIAGVLVGRGGASAAPRALRAPRELGLSSAMISVGQPITFPTDGAATAHGLYYAPTNPEFVGRAGERPPLIVTVHGGPTGMAAAELNLRTQLWTSRGYAVVDVNIRGSSGFGRRYRNELRGGWGVSDVADCIAAARFLIESGRADPERVLIRGGSAGGFTMLAALASSEVFTAGCGLYAVTDLEALARDMHKFESRYTDRLIAPYPEGAAVYRERSPLSRVASIDAPVILFHGTDDPVVPPAQASEMIAALAARGVPHAHVVFPGEGHGFRRRENIVRCLEAELSFYAQVLGFAPPEGVEPVRVVRGPGNQPS